MTLALPTMASRGSDAWVVLIAWPDSKEWGQHDIANSREEALAIVRRGQEREKREKHERRVRWVIKHQHTTVTTYGVEEIDPVPTWTEFTFRCGGCGKTARASKEAIELQRRDFDVDGLTDREIGESFEYCLNCVAGPTPGEHVEEDGTTEGQRRIQDAAEQHDAAEVADAD